MGEFIKIADILPSHLFMALANDIEPSAANDHDEETPQEGPWAQHLRRHLQRCRWPYAKNQDGTIDVSRGRWRDCG